MATPDVGTGATVEFLTSSFSASIMSVSHSGISRPAIDTTHLGTSTARTFIPGDLYNPGQLVLSIEFDPNDNIPISAAAETIRLTYPLRSGQSVAAKVSATGFITDASRTVPLEDKMTSEITIKFSGPLTETDAS